MQRYRHTMQLPVTGWVENDPSRTGCASLSQGIQPCFGQLVAVEGGS